MCCRLRRPGVRAWFTESVLNRKLNWVVNKDRRNVVRGRGCGRVARLIKAAR